jgi:hypothetical protein
LVLWVSFVFGSYDIIWIVSLLFLVYVALTQVLQVFREVQVQMFVKERRYKTIAYEAFEAFVSSQQRTGNRRSLAQISSAGPAVSPMIVRPQRSGPNPAPKSVSSSRLAAMAVSESSEVPVGVLIRSKRRRVTPTTLFAGAGSTPRTCVELPSQMALEPSQLATGSQETEEEEEEDGDGDERQAELSEDEEDRRSSQPFPTQTR